MLPTLPVNDQNDLAGFVVDVRDDVLDQGTYETLARAHGRTRRVPRGGEIRGETREVRRIGRRLRHRLGDEPRRTGFRPAQRRLPVLLQLRGNQAIVRIAGSVTPLRE